MGSFSDVPLRDWDFAIGALRTLAPPLVLCFLNYFSKLALIDMLYMKIIIALVTSVFCYFFLFLVHFVFFFTLHLCKGCFIVVRCWQTSYKNNIKAFMFK